MIVTEAVRRTGRSTPARRGSGPEMPRRSRGRTPPPISGTRIRRLACGSSIVRLAFDLGAVLLQLPAPPSSSRKYYHWLRRERSRTDVATTRSPDIDRVGRCRTAPRAPCETCSGKSVEITNVRLGIDCPWSAVSFFKDQPARRDRRQVSGERPKVTLYPWTADIVFDHVPARE
jgi:hypothetical protein